MIMNDRKTNENHDGQQISRRTPTPRVFVSLTMLYVKKNIDVVTVKTMIK